MRLLGDSIRVRLTLWHTLTVATLLGAFAVGTRIFLVRTTGARADESLGDMARAFVPVWDALRAEHETNARVSAAAAAAEFRDRDRRIVVFDSAGRLIAISDSTPLSPELTRAALTELRRAPPNHAFTTPDPGGDDGAPVRALVTHVTVDGQPFTVLALRSLRAEEDATESYANAVLVAIPIILLLAGLGGYFLAGASLAPIEQAMAQQRQFMADASHELRTPVAALSSVADVALAREDRDPGELREALDVVRGEGRRLGRLVDDLMLLARADAGELPVRKEPMFLEELLQDSARAARGLAAARGVTLSAPPADEAPFVGDADLLRRLVMILLDNAIKYTPAGGEVRLSLDRDSERYRISVQDSGPGVPAWAAERIFERFFRVDESRTRPADDGGTGGVTSAGLGLAIARWAAAAHGGTVQLEASGPSGSRFVVTLPVS